MCPSEVMEEEDDYQVVLGKKLVDSKKLVSEKEVVLEQEESETSEEEADSHQGEELEFEGVDKVEDIPKGKEKNYGI